MSFEERFASVGRALDDLVQSARDRLHMTSHPRPSLDLRRAVSERVRLAQEHCQAAAEHARTRMTSEEHRSKTQLVAVAILCIGATAAVTWFLAAGMSNRTYVEPDWEAISAIATSRDNHNAGQGAPAPVRAGGEGRSGGGEVNPIASPR